MIELNTIFKELDEQGAVWCASNMDAGDLARATEFIVDNNIDLISVAPSAVKTIWPWLEQKRTKIMARFYLDDENITENHVYDVTAQINTAFKSGATGAQVFLHYGALDELVAQTHMIRDDLFFNRELSIGLDLMEIDAGDWENLFAKLQKINASSVLFVLSKDLGNKSDFVGRVYGMLESWNADNKFNLGFMFGSDLMRIEQVVRLVESVRPELSGRIKFFVNI